MIEDAYFFGCVDRPGHFMRDANLQMAERNCPSPWRPGDIDCKMQPGCDASTRAYGTPDFQPEGLSLLHHHTDGWTALSFWDRSIDKRGGCNATFIFRGVFDFEEMRTLASKHFPTVWQRFKFEVRLAA